MIEKFNTGLKKAVVNFAGSSYATGTDFNANTPVYIDPEFEPSNSETYKRLLTSKDYSVVIHNTVANNLLDHPHAHLKLEFTGTVTFVRKSGFAWDANSLINIVTEGNATPPVNSALFIAGNFAKYVRDNLLDDTNGFVSYWQDVTGYRQVATLKDFIAVSCDIRALYMETKTISVTPV